MGSMARAIVQRAREVGLHHIGIWSALVLPHFVDGGHAPCPDRGAIGGMGVFRTVMVFVPETHNRS